MDPEKLSSSEPTPGGETTPLSPEQLKASGSLSSPQPLQEFAGYKIEGELGRGGMGVVYRARDPELKRTVALKVLLHAEHASEEEVKRFFREAESAAKLQHPNIVPIHELKIHEGKHYYTMDYIEGEALDELINSGRASEQECLEILEKVARGLEHAHQNGIVHRDLKPQNIIIAADGEPKVTDFGLAKVLSSGESAITQDGLTRSGTAMGTPMYMAPEQAAGRSKDVDARTDVYALGCILYEMLTGVPPFVSSNAMEILRQHIEDEPLPPRKRGTRTALDVETICLKCLAKEPERRYESAAALADDVRRFLDGEPILARPASVIYRVRKRLQRNRAAAATAAVAAVVIAMLLWVLPHTRLGGSNPRPAVPAGAKPTTPGVVPKSAKVDLSKDLLVHWKFDEGRGIAAKDSSGNNRHGALRGKAGWTAGKVGSAVKLDGDTGFVEVADKDGKLSGMSALTVGCWFKASDFKPDKRKGEGCYLISKDYQGDGNDGTDSYFMGLADVNNSNVKLMAQLWRGGGWREGLHGYVAYEVRMQTNKWYHMALVWDGKESVIYLDARKLSATLSEAKALNSTPRVPLRVGKCSGPRRRAFAGAIDDVRVYNRALSKAEIAALVHVKTSSPKLSPEAKEAKGRQAEAARELGVPVNKTVVLVLGCE